MRVRWFIPLGSRAIVKCFKISMAYVLLPSFLERVWNIQFLYATFSLLKLPPFFLLYYIYVIRWIIRIPLNRCSETPNIFSERH